MSSVNQMVAKANGRIFAQWIIILALLLILINIPLSYYQWRIQNTQEPPPPVLVTGDSPWRIRLKPFQPDTTSTLPFSVYILWWCIGGGLLIGGSWVAWRVVQREKTIIPDAYFSDQLNQALTYQMQINQLLRNTANSYNQAQHQQLTTQLEVWLTTLQTLIRHVNHLQQDTLWQHDLALAPRTLAKLEHRLAYETNPLLRQQLTDSLQHHQQQLALLSGLQTSINQTEVQITSTLALLGTMYAQLLTTQSTHQTANYSRLTQDITEEVASLHDHLEALQEVNALASR